MLGDVRNVGTLYEPHGQQGFGGGSDLAALLLVWRERFSILRTNCLSMANRKENLSLDFKYHGDTHFIDANTLINTQFHFLAIVQEVGRTVNPSIKISVKYQAFKKGSFEVSQLIEIATVAGLFSAPHLGFIKDVLSYVSDYLSIKSFLKGEKATKIVEKKNNQTVEVHLHGSNITVHADAFKVYQNNLTVHQGFIKSGETLLGDENVDGIELIEKKTKESLLSVPRDKFQELTTPNAYLNEEFREELVDATITITKPELSPKGKVSKWNFIYKSRRINGVMISDIDFLKSVSAGLRFGNGDALKVDMKIVYKYDPAFRQYIEYRFEVVLVKETIFNPEQSSFDFD